MGSFHHSSTQATFLQSSFENLSKNYIRKERVFGSVQRRFYIGEIDPDDIKAEFKNGILKLIVPKEEKKLEKKQIVIE